MYDAIRGSFIWPFFINTAIRECNFAMGKWFVLRFVCACAKFNEIRHLRFDTIAKSNLTITKNCQIAAFKVHIFWEDHTNMTKPPNFFTNFCIKIFSFLFFSWLEATFGVINQNGNGECFKSLYLLEYLNPRTYFWKST